MDEVEYYISMLKEGGFSEKIQAAYMLGEMGDERAIRPLVESLRDAPWQLRKEIVEALTKLKPKEHMDILLSCLKDRDPNVRNSAMEAIIAIGEDVVDYLKELVKSQEVETRIYSVNTLGNIGSSKAVDTLIEALEREEDPNVRYEIIEALGKIGDPRATEPLLSLLEGLDVWEKFPVITALGNIGDERALPKIMEFLDSEELKAVAVEALGKIGSWVAFERIGEVLKGEEDREAVKTCIDALYNIYTRTKIFSEITGRWDYISRIGKVLEDIPVSKASFLIDKELPDRDEEYIKRLLFFLRHAKPEGDLPFSLLLQLFHREEFEDELVEILIKLYPFYSSQLKSFLRESKDEVVLSGLLKVFSFFPDPEVEEVALRYLESEELFESALGALRLSSSEKVKRELINYLNNCSDPNKIKMVVGNFLLGTYTDISEYFKKLLDEKPALAVTFFSVFKPDEIPPEKAFEFLESYDPELLKSTLHLISNYPDHIISNIDEINIRKILDLILFDDFQVRIQAISLLSNWADKPFVREGLLGFLDDPNVSDMEKAKILEALDGHLEDQDKSFIVQRLREFSPPLLTAFSSIAEQFKGMDEAKEILEDLIFEYDDPEVKAIILETLGILKDQDLLDSLPDFAEDDNWLILKATLKSSVYLGDNEIGCQVVGRILDRMGKEDINGKDIVIKEAIQASSELSCTDHIAAVAGYLEDPEYSPEAFNALIKIGRKNQETLKALGKSLRSTFGLLLYANILKQVKPQGWREVLEDFVTSPYPSLQEEAKRLLEED